MGALALRRAPLALQRAAHQTGTDDQLVAAVRRGDELAFEAIYDRYHRSLLSFCRHMLGSPQEGEDALQQTFLDAYRNLVSSTKAIQLRGWLHTIARNRCISILRERRPNAPLADAELAIDGLATDIEHREELRELVVDLGRLPDDQRAALLLAELDSFSHEEIAQVVGCPRLKVKALVFQARSSLAARRIARNTPCQEVREQLAISNGAALRRSRLRRHLKDCAGCQRFAAEVRRQRRAMAALLPVVPTSGLKSGLLGALGAQTGVGGAAAGAAGAAAGAVGAGMGASQLIAVGAAVVGLGAGAALGDSASSLTPSLPPPSSSVVVEPKTVRPKAPVGGLASRAADPKSSALQEAATVPDAPRSTHAPPDTGSNPGANDLGGASAAKRGSSDRGIKPEQAHTRPEKATEKLGTDRPASKGGDPGKPPSPNGHRADPGKKPDNNKNPGKGDHRDGSGNKHQGDSGKNPGKGDHQNDSGNKHDNGGHQGDSGKKPGKGGDRGH